MADQEEVAAAADRLHAGREAGPQRDPRVLARLPDQTAESCPVRERAKVERRTPPVLMPGRRGLAAEMAFAEGEQRSRAA